MKNTQKGFVIPLVVIIIAALAVGGGYYYSKQTNNLADGSAANETDSTGYLSEKETLEIAQKYKLQDFKNSPEFTKECLDFDGIREGEFVTYNISGKFGDDCKRNPNADYPGLNAGMDIRVNLVTGEAFYPTLDGEWRSYKNVVLSVPEKIATPDNGGDGSSFLVKKPEWGISFPLPLGWNVTNDVDSQVVLTQNSSGDRITLDYTESQSYTDIDAKRGQVTYTFNNVSRKWIAVENTYTDGGMVSNEAKPVLMIKNIIPVFAGSSRWKTYIIPLSHTQFLKINITGSGQTVPLDEFIKTIIITG